MLQNIKEFLKLHLLFLAIMGVVTLICLHFNIYERNFQFVLPDNISDMILNNLGVFGNIVFLGLISFSFLGVLLSVINVIVLSSNIASMIVTYGFGSILVILSYGFLELMTFSISIFIFREMVKIYKEIYCRQRFDSEMMYFIKNKFQTISMLIVSGVLIIVVASFLEMTVGRWLFDLIV